jgi:hypothetical protein
MEFSAAGRGNSVQKLSLLSGRHGPLPSRLQGPLTFMCCRGYKCYISTLLVLSTARNLINEAQGHLYPHILQCCTIHFSSFYKSLYLSGTLNISQPYGPPWPGTGIALPFFTLTCVKAHRLVLSPLIRSTIWCSQRIRHCKLSKTRC